MIGNEVLRWALAALLLAASLYAAVRAGRTSPPATRVGFALHAAMMIAMVPMLVPGPRWWPALPQVLFFGLAAWWFALRAVSRRPVTAGPQAPAAGPGHSRRAGGAGRGTLLYNALTMAAMAYMLAAMDAHGAGAPLAGPEAAGLPGQTPHHGRPGLSLPGSLPGSEQAWASQPAMVLALAFGLAAAVWGLLLLRRLHTRGRPCSGDAFLELAGSTSMAAMFAALAV